MKKLFSSLFVLGLGLGLNAQTGYKIETVQNQEIDDPELQAQMGAYMGERKSTQYFEGENFRMESGSAMFSIVVISHGDTDSTLMLMDIPMAGQKLAVFMNEEEGKEMEESRKGKDSIVEVKVAKKTKDIMGYECKVVTKITSDDMEQTYWVATDFASDSTMSKEIADGVVGVVLKSSIETAGGPMMNGALIYTDTEVESIEETDVDDSLFEFVVPEGYTMMTYAEYKEQMKKWGRG